MGWAEPTSVSTSGVVLGAGLQGNPVDLGERFRYRRDRVHVTWAVDFMSMFGPDILIRAMSKPSVRDRYGNTWQYNSRSDRHSKVACWGVLFDLLRHSRLLREHASEGKVGFGINHEMYDFKTNRKKNLDLVICTPGSKAANPDGDKFADLARRYDISLTHGDRAELEVLPEVFHVSVGSVLLALEAKACMTAHIKALPRLYDELSSSHLTIHATDDNAVAVGLAMVNFASEFVSSDMNKFDLSSVPANVSRHHQPKVGARTVDKLGEIRRRTRTGEEGYDAFGIICVSMRNDGGPVAHFVHPPAPMPDEPLHYDSMIRRAAQSYQSRFSTL